MGSIVLDYRPTCRSERSRRIFRLLDWTRSTGPSSTNLCADASSASRPPIRTPSEERMTRADRQAGPTLTPAAAECKRKWWERLDGAIVGAGFKPALILNGRACRVTRADRNVCSTFTQSVCARATDAFLGWICAGNQWIGCVRQFDPSIAACVC